MSVEPMLAYHVVDVFTAEAFSGNPLAVVLGADELTSVQCQRLAREFNLSETAFPVAPGDPAADYRLRIFTPAVELPFAGHPSVGAAWLQREIGAVTPRDGRLVQECGAGLVTLTFEPAGLIELTGAPPSVGAPVAPGLAADLRASAGLTDADAEPGLPVLVAGTGVDYVVVPVRLDAVARARPCAGLDAAIEASSRHGMLLLGWDAARTRAHVRMFAAGLGLLEDPATGSAATALGAYLVEAGLVPPAGETVFDVRQGAEIGRPSTLRGRVVARGGSAVTCAVAGAVVPVAEGRIRVPIA